MASGSHVALATTARFSVFESSGTARSEPMREPRKAAQPPPSHFAVTQRLYMLDTYKLVDGEDSDSLAMV